MQHATCSVRTPAIPCLAFDLRSMPCRELQRDGRGAAELCRCATHAQGVLPPPPLQPDATTEKKTFPRQCRGVCGASAEIGFERKKTNARVHTMSTWPNIDVLWCEHWHH
jgi:hypothetical protein